MIDTNVHILNEHIKTESAFIQKLLKETEKVIIGQRYMLERLVMGVLADGHVLLEGVPGLAKTLSIKTLSEVFDLEFSRVQFTPDLLPADIVGTVVYSPKSETFSIKKGPVFANFVLADEINRAPAKVQSALLEVMQERQVTIGNETFKMPEPFLVLATQNPIEQEGTYPLPEAQVDRFMFKVVLDYPKKEEEQQIIKNHLAEEFPKVNKIFNTETIIRARQWVRKVYIDPKIEKYIVDLVFATRYPKDYKLDKLTNFISMGASPRASIFLAIASRAHAFINGRGFVIPDDVKAIAKDVLRHRISISYEAEAENINVEQIIEQILGAVETP